MPRKSLDGRTVGLAPDASDEGRRRGFSSRPLRIKRTVCGCRAAPCRIVVNDGRDYISGCDIPP